jgi:uroporphyrinogen III methyltransferase / synthase
MGKVYLVGAGPGDLKLITLRGFELVQEADVIVHDYLANKDLLSFSRKGAELIYVGKQTSAHEMAQADINRLLVRKAKQHEMVVRLKGGDPFIFGRGGEEAEFLAENGIEFEIIPGVTSAIAAPAYAGMPLTHRDYASSVAFITGHEDEKKRKSTIRWSDLATGPDTLVFLMGIRNLKAIKEKLIRGGKRPDTPCAVVQWGTLPQQKVVSGTLDRIDSLSRGADIKPPGILIVGDVVKLRERLKWFEKRPLFGSSIAVTRAPHQSGKFGKLLADKGAHVIYIPTINIEPIEPNRRLSKALDELSSYYCIIFTSINGASIFLANLLGKGKDIRTLSGIQILPIGDATASLLRYRGIIPDLVPKTFTSEGVVEALKQLKIRGTRFLLPRAEEGRDVIVKHIKAEGGTCDVIPVYRTTLPQSPVPLTEKPDIITFTSSSTVKNFITLYGLDAMRGTVIASIGPVTTRTLLDNGITVDIEAARYDIPGLYAAIENYVVTHKNI